MINDKKQVERAFKIRRYLSLRYLNAFLFFIYLYWASNIYFYISSAIIILPIILMISILVSVKDQFASFSNEKDVDISRSRIIYIINIVLMTIVLLVTLYDYKVLFPYIAGRNYALIVIGVLLALSILSLVKAQKIYTNTDNIQNKYIKYLEEEKTKDSKGSKINYV